MTLGASLAGGGSLGLGPIGSRALKPMRDLVNWFDQTFDAKTKNQALSDRLQAVRRQAVDGEVAHAENAELRPLVRFDRSGVLPPGRLVTGGVLFRSLENPYSFLTISRGSADCVKTGDVAFNGDGLVGKVDRVSQHSARILLVTDHTSAVSAKGESPHIRGLVTPDAGKPGHMVLKFIDPKESPHAGQEIFTSDWHSGEISSGFPAGIPIGSVTRVSLSELEATGSVPVKLAVDLLNLEIVQILTHC
jgi:rod shape-determining protein MreC